MKMDYDDYDFESVLETIEPIYAQEGADSARQFLVDNDFNETVIVELLRVLDQLYSRPNESDWTE
jgi:hypothetical protein